MTSLHTPPRAVVLLSGGLDSATCLAIARDMGFETYALSVAYGQRHAAELAASKRVAQALGAREHRTASVELGQFGGSALTDPGIAVPLDQDNTGIPVTYVPARNTVMLSIALAWAEVLGANDTVRVAVAGLNGRQSGRIRSRHRGHGRRGRGGRTGAEISASRNRGHRHDPAGDDQDIPHSVFLSTTSWELRLWGVKRLPPHLT